MADVGYFDSVSANLKTSVGAQVKGVAEGAKSNSEAGVSVSVNALDTGRQGGRRPRRSCRGADRGGHASASGRDGYEGHGMPSYLEAARPGDRG